MLKLDKLKGTNGYESSDSKQEQQFDFIQIMKKIRKYMQAFYQELNKQIKQKSDNDLILLISKNIGNDVTA